MARLGAGSYPACGVKQTVAVSADGGMDGRGEPQARYRRKKNAEQMYLCLLFNVQNFVEKVHGLTKLE